MNLIDKMTLRVLFTVLSAAAVLGFVWLARKPLVAFLFAMLLAYLLEPPVSFLQSRLHLRRGFAIAITYIAIFGILFTFGLAVGQRVADEAHYLYTAAPELYNKIATGRIAQQLGSARGWSLETQQRLQEFIVAHRSDVLSAISGQSKSLTATAGNALWIVLTPILAVFFLKDKSRFGQNIEALLEDEYNRKLLADALSDLDEMLSHYVRAQLYLAAISAVVYICMLTLLRVPYSLALGTLGGVLEFIPFVGPLVAAALILSISFSLNYGHMLLVLLFLGVWRVLQDYVVSPRVLGGRVEVHPLAAIFGVLAGGEIAGVAGIYFAVPLMAGLRILWNHWRRYNRRPRAAVEPEAVGRRQL